MLTKRTLYNHIFEMAKQAKSIKIKTAAPNETARLIAGLFNTERFQAA